MTNKPADSISDINIEMLFNKRQHHKIETTYKMYNIKNFIRNAYMI